MASDRVRGGSRFEALAAYSRAARAGQVIAVSGTAALDEHGVALHPGDAYGQTRVALERAIASVEQLGGTREQIIRTRLVLATGCDWQAAVRAHGEAFAGVDPANTTLFVAGFIPAGCLVEVELDAVVTP
jgi:enamine deaminase RidA (YjgF/YER057c/UK114 family)